MLNLDGIHEDAIADAIVNLQHVSRMMSYARLSLARINLGKFDNLDRVFNIYMEHKNALNEEYSEFYDSLPTPAEVSETEYNRLITDVSIMRQYLYFRRELTIHMKEGRVQTALEVEDHMEYLYNQLSDDFRW